MLNHREVINRTGSLISFPMTLLKILHVRRSKPGPNFNNNRFLREKFIIRPHRPEQFCYSGHRFCVQAQVFFQGFCYQIYFVQYIKYIYIFCKIYMYNEFYSPFYQGQKLFFMRLHFLFCFIFIHTVWSTRGIMKGNVVYDPVNVLQLKR